MNKDQRENLKALAESAKMHDQEVRAFHEWKRARDKYAQASGPETLLALIDRIQDLEEDVEYARGAVEECDYLYGPGKW